ERHRGPARAALDLHLPRLAAAGHRPGDHLAGRSRGPGHRRRRRRRGRRARGRRPTPDSDAAVRTMIDYITDNRSIILEALAQHVWLSLLPVLVGAVLALPVGYLAV